MQSYYYFLNQMKKSTNKKHFAACAKQRRICRSAWEQTYSLTTCRHVTNYRRRPCAIQYFIRIKPNNMPPKCAKCAMLLPGCEIPKNNDIAP